MSEMIDRVAAAIDAAGEYACHDGKLPAHEDMMDKLSRAAIEALREPTPAMLHAAWKSNWQGLSHDIAITAWRAMIDEALK